MTTAVITNKQTGRKRKLTSCKEVESNRVTYRVQNYLERLGATIHGYNNTITPNGRVSTIMYSHPITDAMAMMTITTNN